MTDLSYNLPYQYLESIGHHDAHLGTTEISLIVTFLGVSSIAGRITSGLIVDRIGSLVTAWLGMVLVGLTIIAMPFCTNFPMLAVAALFYGLTSPLYPVGLPSLIIELFGIENLTKGLGLTYFARGVGSLIGPILTGAIYDSHQSYQWAGVAGGAMVLASAVIGMIMHYQHRQLTLIQPK